MEREEVDDTDTVPSISDSFEAKVSGKCIWYRQPLISLM